jgi:hypothetical protein
MFTLEIYDDTFTFSIEQAKKLLDGNIAKARDGTNHVLGLLRGPPPRRVSKRIVAKNSQLGFVCTFRDYLTVGPDRMTLDGSRVSALKYKRQSVRRCSL